MNAPSNLPALAMNEAQLITVLENSLYPGANPQSIGMVISYCQASGLDPLQKPVHIVPMWDSKSQRMRDVIMPGVGLYRTQAARTGQYAGVTEPEYGEDITEKIDGKEITFPKWCRVTVKRRIADGTIAEFTAREFWKENYAVKGGKDKSIAPNAMWSKRPYAQLAKCAQAQALRIAFPELCSQLTADEMEGKEIDSITYDHTPSKSPASIAVADIPNNQINPLIEIVKGAVKVYDETGSLINVDDYFIACNLDNDQMAAIPGLLRGSKTKEGKNLHTAWVNYTKADLPLTEAERLAGVV